MVPPPYRSDLNEPADLAEEVARLTGLEDIPAELPARRFAYAPPNREREFFRGAREIVQGAGFTEMDTLAFATTADNEKFAGIAKGEPIRVQNPLSEELRQMRRSLVPALLEALRFNLNRQAPNFHAFEIAEGLFARRWRAGGACRAWRAQLWRLCDGAKSASPPSRRASSP